MRARWGALALGMMLVAGCGGTDAEGDCYSPTQNLTRAYEDGAVGCACTEGEDEGVCVSEAPGSNRKVALVCSQGRWQAVEDGPCAPKP